MRPFTVKYRIDRHTSRDRCRVARSSWPFIWWVLKADGTWDYLPREPYLYSEDAAVKYVQSRIAHERSLKAAAVTARQVRRAARRKAREANRGWERNICCCLYQETVFARAVKNVRGAAGLGLDCRSCQRSDT